MGTSSPREAGAKRIAVVDLGTNSTRLLVAEVRDEAVTELAHASQVTRLGRGLELSGQLSSEAIEAVCEAVRGYVDTYSELGPDQVVAIATSAVRDAANGAAFIAELRERFALDAHVLDGEEEAHLTYRGATAGRNGAGWTLVCDIGGGSTELTVGRGSELSRFCSLPIGVVRHSERHLKEDPPSPTELEALADDVHELIHDGLGWTLASADRGIAVAGTATSLGGIDLELDPYDPERVHGHRMALGAIQHICSRLSAMTLEERRAVSGLEPGRAPTIVAGVVILIQVMRAFGLDEIEISEHDILHGAALEAAATG